LSCPLRVEYDDLRLDSSNEDLNESIDN
jgi:hypothetical protein